VKNVRTLNLHCSNFKYKALKKTPVAEETNELQGEYDNVLVCFVCFEKKDEGREDELAKKFAENIRIDHSRIGFSKLLIYPYAHLSKNLGEPGKALQCIKKIKEELNSLNISKAPFGWYKTFSMSVKGHPLAEAYREY